MDLLYIKKCCERIRQDSIYSDAFYLPWDKSNSIIDTFIANVSKLPESIRQKFKQNTPFEYNGNNSYNLDADVTFRAQYGATGGIEHKLIVFMDNTLSIVTLADDYSNFKFKIIDGSSNMEYRGFADDLNLKIPSLKEEFKGINSKTARGYHIYPDKPLLIEYGPTGTLATSDELNQ